MATKDTVVQELVVNTLTQAQFDAAKEAGTLSPYELYGTPDTSVRLPVLTPMWFDHLANDVSWLRADTFSWQSGDVYVAAYEHLLADFEGTIAETETIDDITIAFYRAEDKHKICLPDQESNISALYEATGAADYYLLDTTNKQFKLPRKQKRRLIQAVKNTDGTWYNMYSDGWVEQGGFLSGSWTGARTFNLPVAMSDTGYTVTNTVGCPSISSMNGLNYLTGRTKTSITFTSRSLAGNFETNNFSWQVNGYAAETAYASAGMQLEYYYVGNYTQDAVEQTAGITSETLNSKLDIGAGNATDETKATIIGWGVPDYSAGISISNGGTIPKDGLIIVQAVCNSGYKKVSINGIQVFMCGNGANTELSATYPVSVGDIITHSVSSVKFYPYKGVNQ